MRFWVLALAMLGLGGDLLAQVPDATKVEALARQAMAETGARGLAIAVIDGGRVDSVQAFGERNAKGEPLTVDTVMYGASLTKAVFAYTVMQLVEEGKLDLDRRSAIICPGRFPIMAISTPMAIGATSPTTSAGGGSRRASC